MRLHEHGASPEDVFHGTAYKGGNSAIIIDCARRGISIQKNGPTARSGPLTLTPMMSLIPAISLVAIDARRRPVTATVAYGITLLATMAWSLSRTPPDIPENALALTPSPFYPGVTHGRPDRPCDICR